MKADPVAQRRLLDVSELDVRTNQLQHQRSTLPEHAQIAALMGERKILLEQYVEAETRVADLTRDQERAEADLEPVRARLARDQQKLDSGAITDRKALTGLQSEVEHLHRRISDLEDAELEVMGLLEEATTDFAGHQQRRRELEDRIRALMAARDEKLGGLDQEIARAAEHRATILGKLPEPLVKVYEKAHQHTGAGGAAALTQRRCMGCRLELDPGDLRAIAVASPDEVVRCEECGRVLIRSAESGL
ncbi:zinc ribbon domain-containing protein [Granulicoccus phenolivorans]|uniref:zinc ribbon domain-containing protein n=1 Tax=Granulicoccus phenolivorans TaxID=266854 RepID=UPI0004078B74|nr:C4-type zinc ribbon domain-containing protein [Granulicoccus phenolivorans]